MASVHALVFCVLFVCGSLFAGSPQGPLPVRVLGIGKTSVRAEVADTPAARQAGLMHRNRLADGDGMLFVFPAPQPMNFWMRDTSIPLSIAYINASGVIREIHDMQPLDETPVQSFFGDLVYALEVPQGWFGRNGILPGDIVSGLPPPNSAE